ncbi:glutamate N-acetyltransferase/amino-acid N-acetyltransferase [Aequitasia blattaphilus]|uniref:Arginine biosynthesis bifunctional protein ArgJ n=1 Tax=Aequitasia blattaphilus TaxID=2949332 RepID=A0ABT1E9J5_9FIRM|nr:bifunctional glutamate N-acetyltransferase/amino-acid acetyltransferase ArgJ [Aequitasia blattaphilus]MCP1102279.1 bifunctional glutamate N-acetyltransferase/amino-acid acetyltransferase ArgJ [Aequitasia blattaphilus]MCR8614919.1 bifunctional glutamate N-acetyltransferase/amino-acid acetyltransferase ArgJ [Aequitasia blattaphilus]
MKKIEGAVTAAKGFEAAGVAAGVKYKDRMDMAMIYSNEPCVAAGAFTQNIVKAAPVLYDKEIIDSKKKVKAVVVNSGIANACTGKEGFAYCEQSAKITKEALGFSEEVLVGSTGVIGMQLPMDKIEAGILALAKEKKEDVQSSTNAANAILTTDTRKKEIAFSFEIQGTEVKMGGMAKGSGMIHPNMCTMLSFVTTDANISGDTLQKALSEDVPDTYNMISVDGDTSTNDTVLVLANGLAGNAEICYGTEEYNQFKNVLHEINVYLAKEIAGDGEGATALFEVEVKGAKTEEDAKKIAKSVVCSDLTKTAIAGHDANWGRILCAMGYSGGVFTPENVNLSFVGCENTVIIMKDGDAVSYSEEEATKILSENPVKALIELNEGKGCATAWGCDLTHGYIEINADYRS